MAGMHHCFPGESNRHDPTQSVARSARPCTPCEGLTISRGVCVRKVQSSRVAGVRPSIRAFQFYERGASPLTLVMKRLIKVSAIIAMIVSLGACTEFSVYKPAPDVPLANVRLSPEMAKETLVMCQAPHDCHELPPFNDVIQVPTNQRVSLYRKYQGSPYGREGFCSAGISFEPKYGQRYFAAFRIIGNKCTLRIYRWSPKNARPQPFEFEFGQSTLNLAAYATFDPTMGPPIPLYKN
jgi:hypothetical protein